MYLAKLRNDVKINDEETIKRGTIVNVYDTKVNPMSLETKYFCKIDDIKFIALKDDLDITYTDTDIEYNEKKPFKTLLNSIYGSDKKDYSFDNLLTIKLLDKLIEEKVIMSYKVIENDNLNLLVELVFIFNNEFIKLNTTLSSIIKIDCLKILIKSEIVTKISELIFN